MRHPQLSAMGQDRAVVVVRADRIADPVRLAAALVAGGIRSIEFTFTTPGVTDLVSAAAAANTGAVIGVGTVLTAEHAAAAIDAGARFLVTPGLRPAVTAVARDADVAMVTGALTPTEVLQAVEDGSDAVKIFPAQTVGADHFAHLHGPFPGIDFLASGGVHEGNASTFLARGAAAVAAGSSVLPAALAASDDWSEISRRARAFVTSLG